MCRPQKFEYTNAGPEGLQYAARGRFTYVGYVSKMSDETIRIGSDDLRVWPHAQNVSSWGDPKLLLTTFGDTDSYHGRLIDLLVGREQDKRGVANNPLYACGIKIHHLDQLQSPEADLLTERARKLFRTVLDQDDAVVDASWASVYRQGEYCAAHSHLRTTACVVYSLDPGDADPEDKDSGRFWIIDPRIAGCCGSQKGCMTTPIAPQPVAGTMLIFPGEVVHTVWPYHGKRPRITLSWNINGKAVSDADSYHRKRIRKQQTRIGRED